MSLTRHDKKQLSHMTKAHPGRVKDIADIAKNISGVRARFAQEKHGVAKRKALQARIKSTKGYGEN